MTLRRLVRPATLLFLLGLLGIAIAFRTAIAEAAAQVRQANVALLSLSFALLVAGRGVLAVASWAVAATELTGVPARPATMAWLRSAVSKYIPGLIWQSVSAVEGLRRSGASTVAGVGVVMVDTAANLSSATIVGMAALPALFASDRGETPWLILLLPVLVLLHPRVFAVLLHGLERLVGQEGATGRPSWSLIVRMVALQAGGWLLAGASLAVAIEALGAHAPLMVAIPASALSWAVGLLVIIAPAGLGIREGVLVALLIGLVSSDVALAVALLSRAMFIGVDLLAAVVAVAATSESRRRSESHRAV